MKPHILSFTTVHLYFHFSSLLKEGPTIYHIQKFEEKIINYKKSLQKSDGINVVSEFAIFAQMELKVPPFKKIVFSVFLPLIESLILFLQIFIIP